MSTTGSVYYVMCVLNAQKAWNYFSYRDTMFTVATGTDHKYSYVDVPTSTASNSSATDSKSEYMTLQDRTKAEPGRIELKLVCILQWKHTRIVVESSLNFL